MNVESSLPGDEERIKYTLGAHDKALRFAAFEVSHRINISEEEVVAQFRARGDATLLEFESPVAEICDKGY